MEATQIFVLVLLGIWIPVVIAAMIINRRKVNLNRKILDKLELIQSGIDSILERSVHVPEQEKLKQLKELARELNTLADKLNSAFRLKPEKNKQGKR